jgi:hypothetical protein
MRGAPPTKYKAANYGTMKRNKEGQGFVWIYPRFIGMLVPLL